MDLLCNLSSTILRISFNFFSMFGISSRKFLAPPLIMGGHNCSIRVSISDQSALTEFQLRFDPCLSKLSRDTMTSIDDSSIGRTMGVERTSTFVPVRSLWSAGIGGPAICRRWRRGLAGRRRDMCVGRGKGPVAATGYCVEVPRIRFPAGGAA